MCCQKYILPIIYIMYNIYIGIYVYIIFIIYDVYIYIYI